jgi:hypothetical protein
MSIETLKTKCCCQTKPYPDVFVHYQVPMISTVFPSQTFKQELNKKRYLYVTKEINAVPHNYFCNYTKFLPPVDMFSYNLIPNCSYTTTGQLMCRTEKKGCLKKF